MHPASLFHERDPLKLASLFDRHGLAVIAGTADGRPLIGHAPVLLREGRLRFHLSAANPLCAPLKAGGRAVAVATGPDAYISPDWYGAPDQVPTWNYLSAEAEGPVRVLDRGEAIALLDDLSARFEAMLAPKSAWTRDKLAVKKFDALLAGIVAFEMRVERLEGIVKLSQNKSAEMIAGVAAELEARGDSGAREIAALMRSLGEACVPP
jgi:transcriptional regulator